MGRIQNIAMLKKIFVLDVAGNIHDRVTQVVRLEHAENALGLAAEKMQTDDHEIGGG